MKTKKLFYPMQVFAIVLVLLIACSKEKISEKEELKISVGDKLHGGIIAYILQPNDQGYVAGETHGIVATEDDFLFGKFGCYGGSTQSPTGTGVGSGRSNTKNILLNCNDSMSLAARCDQLVVGGFDDWYMPSKDELEKLVLNKKIIGGMYAGMPMYASSSALDSLQCYGFETSILGELKLDRIENLRTRAIRSF